MPDLVFTKQQPGWDKEFLSPEGMVGRDLKRRARLVERAAKKQVGVDTHNLQHHIRTEMSRSALGPHAEVGCMVEPVIGYAYWHHEGTRPHLIAASPGKFLEFSSRGAHVRITAVHHPGTKANRYLSDNLPLAVI